MSVYPHPASHPGPWGSRKADSPLCRLSSALNCHIQSPGWAGGRRCHTTQSRRPYTHGPLLHTHTHRASVSELRELREQSVYGIDWGGFDTHTHSWIKIHTKQFNVISKQVYISFFLQFRYRWIMSGLKVVYIHHKAFILNRKWTCEGKITCHG